MDGGMGSDFGVEGEGGGGGVKVFGSFFEGVENTVFGRLTMRMKMYNKKR